jgi:hypothetical protein
MEKINGSSCGARGLFDSHGKIDDITIVAGWWLFGNYVVNFDVFTWNAELLKL